MHKTASGVVLISQEVIPQDKEIKLPKPGTLQAQLNKFTTQPQPGRTEMSPRMFHRFCDQPFLTLSC